MPDPRIGDQVVIVSSTHSCPGIRGRLTAIDTADPIDRYQVAASLIHWATTVEPVMSAPASPPRRRRSRRNTNLTTGRTTVMSDQTRIAYLSEYRAARASKDFDRALEITFDAMDHDANHPGEPRLMDEIRGLHTRATDAA